MRATVLCAAVASLVVIGPLPAQESRPDTASASAILQQRADSTTSRGVVRDTIQFGDREIPAGVTVAGPVVVSIGDLRVRGTIAGTAVVIVGDIEVAPGGRITGDAIAAFGTVTASPGTIGGQQRAISGTLGQYFGLERRAAETRRTTQGALSLSLGWLVMVLLIGIGVLVFAGNYLEGAADVLQRSFWRSFFVGLAGQLAIVPALVLLVLALTVTVVGILLIPFAIVAFVLAIAGLVTLGFLAMARLTGGSIGAARAEGLRDRGRALRGLLLGIAIYLGMWVIAAVFQWSPAASGVLRGIAFVITYAAATAGFGAAILSRGGTKRDVAATRRVSDEQMAVWQTPTPVTGVTAARRPTPAGAPRR
jgi:hypothetical protein